MTSRVATVPFLLTSLALSAQQPPTAFQFRPVAQPGTTIGGHTLPTETAIDAVALNDAGEIAFIARWADHATVFTSQRAVASQGEVIDGKYLVSIAPRVMINAAGQVAYEAGYSDTKADVKGSGIFVDKRLALTLTPGSPFTLTDDGSVTAKDESPTAPKKPSVLERVRDKLSKPPKDFPIAVPPNPKAPQQKDSKQPSNLPFPINRRGQVLIPVNLGSGFLLLLGTPVSH